MADDIGSDLLAIARTDSEAATLITSTIDPRDHAYVLGSTNASQEPLSVAMAAAEEAGASGDRLQAVEDAWVQAAGLKLFDEAVADAIAASSHADKAGLARRYAARAKGRSNAVARRAAREILGRDVHFDWEAPRTREGYYRYKGGCQCAVTRAVAYAPYADCIWMESKLPDFAQAKEFADGVHAVWPQQKWVPPLP
jgi:isocitrate lyase